METVKKTDSHTIVKKKSGRFGVMDKKGKWINAEEKVKILLAEKLIAAPKAKAPVVEEAPAEEAAPEATPEA